MDGAGVRALLDAGHAQTGVALFPPGDPGIHTPLPLGLPIPLARHNDRVGALPREPAEHAALIAALQEHHLADDLEPPAEAIGWPAELLAHWFECGGCLLLHERAAAQFNVMGGSGAWRAASFSLDDVYASLSVRPAWLTPTGEAGSSDCVHSASAWQGDGRFHIDSVCSGGHAASAGRPAAAPAPDAAGILGAIARGDTAALKRVALALNARGWAAVRLGLSAALWQEVCAEGARAYPHMRPGELIGGDGTRSNAGESPSGLSRGDRFVYSHELESVPMPSVATVVTAVSLVAGALTEPLETYARLKLMQRTQSLFACFPGGGAQYGAHFDGGGVDGRRLTAVAYSNLGWSAEDGGELLLLDESPLKDEVGVQMVAESDRPAKQVAGDNGCGEPRPQAGPCWRAVAPLADTLILFRADRMLHKVAPSNATRYAITTFFFGHALEG